MFDCPRRCIFALQLCPLNSRRVRWSVCRSAYGCLLAAVIDTLFLFCLVSSLGSMKLGLYFALQPLFSCMRLMVAIAHAFNRRWLTAARLSDVFGMSAMISSFHFASCAYGVVQVTPELAIEDLYTVFAKLSALACISVGNAVLSTFMWIDGESYGSGPSGAPLQACEEVPFSLLKLREVTLHTCVLEDSKALASPCDEPREHETCCFCLFELLPGDMVTELKCHHRYHMRCLDAWEKSQRRCMRPMVCPFRCDT
eukprot:TRINITY_DN74960_c0_g1_i1.p1 TRINITY_DN74960_c0_g1~~TRINITY_DN74960_c0_g1_i1.p1  ORF type:complete len:255 (+),score=14.41 TRINITY_DN74960_c0_g1_i1:65-829(+)